jgi:hypothetical protein
VPGAGQIKASGERLSDRVAIGVLTQAFSPSLVDDVLARTGRMQQRSRLLPARLVVYFVLAMCPFPGQAYEEVARLLTVGLQGARRWRSPWTVDSAPPADAIDAFTVVNLRLWTEIAGQNS